MPLQRIRHSREALYEVPMDFPKRLRRFQEEYDLSRSDIARLLGRIAQGMRKRRLGNGPRRLSLLQRPVLEALRLPSPSGSQTCAYQPVDRHLQQLQQG